MNEVNFSFLDNHDHKKVKCCMHLIWKSRKQQILKGVFRSFLIFNLKSSQNEETGIIDIHVILEVGEHDRKSVLFDTKWRYFQGFIYKLKFPAINQVSCLITMNSLMKNFHELYFAIDVVNTHNMLGTIGQIYLVRINFWDFYIY